LPLNGKRIVVSTGRRKTLNPGLEFERNLWEAGLLNVVGLDEAGRGAWAGPVAAAAVILPSDKPSLDKVLSGVRDSKQMTAGQRSHWAAVIRSEALAFGVGLTGCEEIDREGILRATRLAMERALYALTLKTEYLLLDAILLRSCEIGQTALIKGDCISLSIAAASILAKTARDQIMVEMEVSYPGYGFARHKGYGTNTHRQALRENGICEIHRRSFRPVKDCTG
jgi:ribonuclease HII